MHSIIDKQKPLPLTVDDRYFIEEVDKIVAPDDDIDDLVIGAIHAVLQKIAFIEDTIENVTGKGEWSFNTDFYPINKKDYAIFCYAPLDDETQYAPVLVTKALLTDAFYGTVSERNFKKVFKDVKKVPLTELFATLTPIFDAKGYIKKAVNTFSEMWADLEAFMKSKPDVFAYDEGEGEYVNKNELWDLSECRGEHLAGSGV